MNETTAILVFAGIMSLAVVIWLIGLYYSLRVGTSTTTNDWQSQDAPAFGQISGEAICTASKEELLQRLPKLWKRQTLGILNSTFSVVDKSDQEISVVRLGPVLCNLPPALYFSGVRFRIEPKSQNESRVLYTIDQTKVMSLLRRVCLTIVLSIGLPVIVGVGLLIWFLVIPNANPGVRGQVFQAGQVIHVLWPPFMFIGIAAAARRSTKAFVERILIVASDAELANNPVGVNFGVGQSNRARQRNPMNQNW